MPSSTAKPGRKPADRARAHHRPAHRRGPDEQGDLPILRISIKTVETHRASALHKLGARTTADLIRYAIRNRMIDV